jgi:hypothetical protein
MDNGGEIWSTQPPMKLNIKDGSKWDSNLRKKPITLTSMNSIS